MWPVHVHGWHCGMGKRYWRVVGVQEFGINYLSLYTDWFICDLLGMCAVQSSYQRPLVGRLFYRFCLPGFMLSWQRCKRCKSGLWSILSGEQAVKCVWILWYSLLHRTRSIAQTVDSCMPYQRNYSSFVSLVNYPRINLYVDILIWSYP